jgi:hypothetical protein
MARAKEEEARGGGRNFNTRYDSNINELKGLIKQHGPSHEYKSTLKNLKGQRREAIQRRLKKARGN